MGDNHYGSEAFGGNLLEEVKDSGSVVGIKIAGWFVGQKKGRSVN